MAIIEIHGGPITHRYLIGKTKDELARLYMRLLQDTEQDAKDAERYRWIRACDADGEDRVMIRGEYMARDELMSGDKLDQAIDGAMREQGANT